MSCGTRVSFTRALRFTYRAVTVYGRPFQDRSITQNLCNSSRGYHTLRRIPRPRLSNAGTLALNRFRLFPFRSPLLGESLICFLFLQVLRCFSSLGSLPGGYEFTAGWQVVPARVVSFGDLRVKAC